MKRLTLRGSTHDELIAEVCRRLTAGWFGYHGLMSTNQADHRDMWIGLHGYVVDLRNRNDPSLTAAKIHTEMLRLADEHTPAPPFAVNTTVYDRDIATHQRDAK